MWRPHLKMFQFFYFQYKWVFQFISCVLLGITLGEDLSPEKKLHKRLFNDSYYSVDLLPLTNLSSTINVSFGFDLVKIVNVVSDNKSILFLLIIQRLREMKGVISCC